MAVILTQIKHVLRKHTNLKMLGVAFLAIFALFHYCTREPAYEGKTVTQWIEEGEYWFRGSSIMHGQYSSLKDIEKVMAQYKAYLAIKAIGPSAAPYLERTLKMKSMKFTTRIYDNIYSSQYLPQFIKKKLPLPHTYETTTIKSFAACTLLCMNMSSCENQIAIFEILIKSFDPSLRSIAFKSLRSKTFTNEQIEKLIDKLYWKSRDYKSVLYLINHELDFKGTNLNKYFVPLLKDSRAVIRQETVVTLKNLGPFALQALPDLMIIATNDSDRSIRLASIRAIGAMGPAAKEAMPLLLSLTNSQEKLLSLEVINALHAINPENSNI